VDDACPEEVPAEQVTLPEDTPEYPPDGLHVILAFGLALPCAVNVIANDGAVPRRVRKKAAQDMGPAAAKSLDCRTITLSQNWGRHKLR